MDHTRSPLCPPASHWLGQWQGMGCKRIEGRGWVFFPPEDRRVLPYLAVSCKGTIFTHVSLLQGTLKSFFKCLGIIILQ